MPDHSGLTAEISGRARCQEAIQHSPVAASEGVVSLGGADREHLVLALLLAAVNSAPNTMTPFLLLNVAVPVGPNAN